MPDGASKSYRCYRPIKGHRKGNGFFECDIHIKGAGGEGNLLQVIGETVDGGIPPYRPGSYANDILDPKIAGEPVWRMVVVVYKERSAVDSRIPITPDKD